MSHWLDKDQVSALAKKATDILFVKNPQGTSMGTLFGMILYGLTKIFDPMLQGQQIVDLTKVSIVFWMLAGIFIFNLPSLLRRPRFDPQIEAALALIAKLTRAGQISPAQTKLMYRSLCEKVLTQITLDKPTEEQVRERHDLSGGRDILSSP